MRTLLVAALFVAGCHSSSGTPKGTVVLDRNFLDPNIQGCDLSPENRAQLAAAPPKVTHVAIPVGPAQEGRLDAEVTTATNAQGIQLFTHLRVRADESRGLTLGAGVGNCENRGTRANVRAAVPLTVTWTRSRAGGTESGTAAVLLFADGTSQKL